ncbi:MAG: hypothetical protein MJZ16_08530 [Bacteroidales bacterium]|nr:hypothetical protein [Bacteroidales bacterium]
MGGGKDSRIPSILKEHINDMAPLSFSISLDVVVRTYDFDPEIAEKQISSWVDELDPILIIGESMGSIHALAIKGVPHLFVSPALNAPLYFSKLAVLTKISLVTKILDRIYKPRPGERQPLHFTYDVLSKWGRFRDKALANSPKMGGKDYFHAFIGTRDHYRRSGVVRLSTWKKYYGEDSVTIYEGTHFMEEEFILSLLIPKIFEVLS